MDRLAATLVCQGAEIGTLGKNLEEAQEKGKAGTWENLTHSIPNQEHFLTALGRQHRVRILLPNE